MFVTCKSVNFVNIVSVILDCVLLVTRLDFVVYFYIISQSRHSFVHSLAEKKLPRHRGIHLHACILERKKVQSCNFMRCFW